MSTIHSCLDLIRSQIQQSANGRNVLLVAVSKFHPVETLMEAYNAGQRHFGENYMQEFLKKVELMPDDVQWHFIGSLQSSKCKKIASVKNLYSIETIDTEKKARLVNSAREALQLPLNVYIQVNTSGEENKGGVTPSKVLELCKQVQDMKYLRLKGLMTIGSISNSQLSDHNPDFQVLSDLRESLQNELGIPLQLSMGMSSDYLLAIKYGSDSVRVGSSIFGSRPTEKPSDVHISASK
ncbi:Pyridoxal phosphate homeostasis protein [Schizosaccharomyces pombe]|uniref:Pyridoxal phosphate homeostasis protein n=1 Tax=Schizosaccharomyces pombe (strain 972 / ATCC 24843) TaxID=284812 RepID=PLPHP_SCHPO|nr:putative alanine racemase [Schizosaccharomyces pombe]Q9P6Q1.1 RecName: Full=Pyridoxal phosphate homeostasis protein; Short=PLP homeostasis protein [Schizosaccharomyces pombe 972h-]CAB90136.1 alanine racemase (predicted) [Schizosaccharomyces pombe]|eukprot:NP_593877.1 putative alanine racemase [Schizosaccharomyces pombe]